MAKNTKEPAKVEEVTAVVGRPSSFDPEYGRTATFMCKLGATDQELAEYFGVTVRTLNRWKITHPEFSDAIKRGKEASDDRVEDSLYHKALEREIEEEQAIKLKTVTYGDNGKRLKEEERVEIVMVKKFIPGDTTAMIFWLKNRRAQDWRDVHKHEHGKAGDFDQMSCEELDQFITVEAQELLPAPAPAPPPPAPKRGRQATKH